VAAGEWLPGLGPQPVGDVGGQRPGQHGKGECGACLHCGGGRGPVVGVAGDAGVVEGQQAVGMILDGQPGDGVASSPGGSAAR